MYKVLIVDDEKLAVLGVKASVEWSRLNLEEPQLAYSAKQAREVLHAHSVDIMICDIEMPQETGIELLAWVREHYPTTEVIFLTCHASFQYAQDAIRLGSFDYLLKPVDGERLEEVLGKTVDRLHEQRHFKSLEENVKSYGQMKASYQAKMQEQFWLDLLHERIPASHQRIQEQLDRFKLPYDAVTRFVPIFIQIQAWHRQFSQREERLLEYGLLNAAQELLTDFASTATAMYIDDRELIVMVVTHPDANAMETALNRYITASNAYFYCDICCYIGVEGTPGEMPATIRALQQMSRNNVMQTNRSFKLGQKLGEQSMAKYPEMDIWKELLREGAKKKLQDAIGDYLDGIRHEVDANWLQVFYQDFLQMVFAELQSKGLQAHSVFATSVLAGPPESALRSLRQLREWMLYLTEVLINHLHSIQENHSAVDKAKQYILSNLGLHELTREAIASDVYLNPDYLTRIFRKETGVALSDYIQDQRLMYARRLLLNTTKSISDISQMAGYSNMSYFSKVFKKKFLLTPMEFRKTNQ